MGRHSKLKKARREHREQFVYSNESGRINDTEIAEFNAELKEQGWSNERIDALNSFREFARAEDAKKRLRNEQLQQWASASKSLKELSGFNYPVYSLKTYQDRVASHVRSLLTMSIHLDPLNSDSTAFLGETRSAVYRMGQELYAFGGKRLMAAIAMVIPSPFARELDYAWDGIGGWRA